MITQKNNDFKQKREELELVEYQSLREELCSKQETGTNFLQITIGGICAILVLVCSSIFEYGGLLLQNNKGQLTSLEVIFPLILPIVLLAVGIPGFCLLSVYHLKQERQWLYYIIKRLQMIENDLTQDCHFKFWEQCLRCKEHKIYPHNIYCDPNCYLHEKKVKCHRYQKLLKDTNKYHDKYIPRIFYLLGIFCQLVSAFLVIIYVFPNSRSNVYLFGTLVTLILTLMLIRIYRLLFLSISQCQGT